MDCDVVIVGGGPAGLAFARSLEDCGLSIVLLERAPLEALATPRFDGREIALTHGSRRILEQLGAWMRLPAGEIAPLHAAKVVNGDSPFALNFTAGGGADDQLGWLVPNHRIRAALYDAVLDQPGLRIVTGAEVVHARSGAMGPRAEVLLSSGEVVRAKLLVVADSRLSKTREALGIDADIHPLGRSMMVVRVRHELPHGSVALEWFDHRQTLALLPLAANTAGAVLTLPEDAARRVMAFDDAALGRDLTRRFRQRLGRMEVVSDRNVYPLVTSWAHQFVSGRAALIGDAAVGMHPVTAHGFNLGLSGQAMLAAKVRDAVRRGMDPALPAALRRYEQGHRAACRPLYTGTNLLVRLFTNERPAARAMRHAVLRLGAGLPFVRPSVRAMLTH
ncbi:5-demethoxyubiquinol-8 5-hydroxylase UbiM [Sphingomonas elodea]|uniref:5-demethoxyubiquinol-8 5-hydroxylase UbiM n=1 Tax=Sphingomonas elodea TaxID=179878 RepID=UPI00026310AE|nr:5-demethoxyubiquinol-8 5-hydroxylase UbiM [Sphingomonas elodea]